MAATIHLRIRKRWRILGFLLTLIGLAPLISGGASDVSIPADRLIQFLNQTISFYQQTTIQQQIATEPQEQILLYDNRQIANQVVGFAFDFARAQIDNVAAEPASTTPANADSGSERSGGLTKTLDILEKQLMDTQAEADSDRKKLSTAAGSQRAQLESEVSELQGEIALTQARRDAIRNMRDFVSGSATSRLDTTGLKAQIDALAASVPGASSDASNSSQTATQAQTNPVTAKAAPSDIWDLVADLYNLSGKRRAVKAMIDETNTLLRTSNELRAPFVAQMQLLSNDGDDLAAQADTADSALLAQEKRQLDALATQFKQISAAVIPLGKQRVLLNLYQKNLTRWQDDIGDESKSDLGNLGVRLGLLALTLGILIGLSELSRRAVYRYVHDTRRRHQFLLIRRLAMWAVIALIIAGTLAGRLGSFVTFAGLLTAGVAVALQNVIVSVVGYFFLISKFGIRVGDRVEVSGTTGEVIDIGLVRFHLMEYGPGGTATGRVVAFSNSVVFQSATGLFRQIPGASFAWHQVTLTLPRDIDFALIQKDILGAINKVLKDYHEDLQRLSDEMEKRGVLFAERGLQPKLELRLQSGGVEATVRYPVDLQHASDIDARVSRELLTVLERDSKSQPAEHPVIQKTDVSPSTAD